VGTGAPWEYAPSSAEVNKDVLRLARHFGLQHLHEHAARWLAKGLTTANVVERLVTCEEFGLGLLREKIMEQLTKNPAELATVSSSTEIMKHPKILQDLLMQVASAARAGAAAAAAAEKEKEDKAREEKEKEKEKEREKEKEKEAELQKAQEKAAAAAAEAAAATGAKRERDKAQGKAHEKAAQERPSKKSRRGTVAG